MAKDYTKIIATAQRLIAKYGRTVTLLQFNTTPADALKPWNGPADPRASPLSTLDLFAVVVHPDSASKMGLASETSDLLKRSSQIMIVSAGAQVDLSVFNEVTDDSKQWKIQGSETLRPGGDTIISIIGVAQ